MRKIGIRQFQQNFHLELANPPFVVTKNGEDYRVVTSLDLNVTTSKQSIDTNNDFKTKSVNTVKAEILKSSEKIIESINTSTNKNVTICQMPRAFCHNGGKLYKLTTYQEEGEANKEMILCDKHIRDIQKQGIEVAIV